MLFFDELIPVMSGFKFLLESLLMFSSNVCGTLSVLLYEIISMNLSDHGEYL